MTANRKTLSPKTTGRRLTSLRGFARWAGQGAILLDYTAPTPLKPVAHPLLDGMEGIYRMLAQAEREGADQLHACVALCGLAGLRIGETLILPPSNVDFQNKGITVLGKGSGGNGKERWVPMSHRLTNILLEPTIRMIGKPTLLTMGDRLARRSITRLARRVGITQPVSSHQLRATFATHLSSKGVPLRTIQEILGHANVTQTEVYTAVNQKQMRDAVEEM